MHSLPYIVECLNICLNMLRHLSYCATLNQDDRQTLDEEIQMYSGEINSNYEQPLCAIGESTL